jgi:hypothetical protein
MPDTVLLEGVPRDIVDVFDTYVVEWGIDEAVLPDWAPPGHPEPQPGDCDDSDATVHPENAEPEVYYDGIDRDCDHHNDFDVDNDCFMPPGAAADYDDYVLRYYGEAVPPFCVDPELPFGDCLDVEDPSIIVHNPDDDDPTSSTELGPVPPQNVHPATTTYPNLDDPYDWIDADCGQDNDFDADMDAFLPEGIDPLGAMAGYAAMWGYEELVDGWAAVNPDAALPSPAPGDCDDTLDDTWPGALEKLGDGLDQDCAGDIDTSAFGFGDGTVNFDWTNPTNPEITRLGDSYLVMVGAESASIGTSQVEFGVAMPFGVGAARGGAGPLVDDFRYWKSSVATLPIQGLLDIAMQPNPPDWDKDGIPDPVVQTLSNSDSTIVLYTYLNLNGLKLSTADGSLLSAGSTPDLVPSLYEANAIDLVIDANGDPFSLACAADRLHAMHGITSPAHNTITTDFGEVCFFTEEPALAGTQWEVDFSLCTAGLCNDWTLDDAINFTDNGASTDTWVYGDLDEGWMSLIASGGEAYIRAVGGTEQRVFPDYVVTHLDTDEHDGNIYAAAVVEGASGPEVWLEYGPLAGPRETVPLPFDDPSVTGEQPVSVAVFADLDRVAIAVTATTGLAAQDSVGWVFLGP